MKERTDEWINECMKYGYTCHDKWNLEEKKSLQSLQSLRLNSVTPAVIIGGFFLTSMFTIKLQTDGQTFESFVI